MTTLLTPLITSTPPRPGSPTPALDTGLDRRIAGSAPDGSNPSQCVPFTAAGSSIRSRTSPPGKARRTEILKRAGGPPARGGTMLFHGDEATRRLGRHPRRPCGPRRSPVEGGVRPPVPGRQGWGAGAGGSRGAGPGRLVHRTSRSRDRGEGTSLQGVSRPRKSDPSRGAGIRHRTRVRDEAETFDRLGLGGPGGAPLAERAGELRPRLPRPLAKLGRTGGRPDRSRHRARDDGRRFRGPFRRPRPPGLGTHPAGIPAG